MSSDIAGVSPLAHWQESMKEVLFVAGFGI